MNIRMLALAWPAAMVLAVGASLASAQTEWVKHPDSPVLCPGAASAWDDNMAGAGSVIWHDGQFKMWYEGNEGIGYATSPDGIVWTKHAGNPVLMPGSAGAWDAAQIDSPSVIAVDGVYHMWYSGVDAQDDNRIGHATSPDGLVWTKDPANPVIDTNDPYAWDAFEAIHPFVLYDDGAFKMYYNGHDGLEQRILLATSDDGSAWTRYTSGWMLEPGAMGQWDDCELGPMTVLRAADGYHMWYTGWNDQDEFAIGYATSPNGLWWTKDTEHNPVLTRGAAGEWDDLLVFEPCIIQVDTVLTMWYSGWNGSLVATGLATANSSLVATYLQSFAAAWAARGVEISWRLSHAEDIVRFSVLRAQLPGEHYLPLAGAEIAHDGPQYACLDRTAQAGAAYRYRVDLDTADGIQTLFTTEPIAIPIRPTALDRIYPNPFNPQTTIEYTLAAAGPVRLGVYDARGRLVRTLAAGPQAPGSHARNWDGRDEAGLAAASGVYFIRLEANAQVRTAKAILSR